MSVISNESKTMENGGDGKPWRAEEAIGGNREALETLRELITFPLLYSNEAQKIGLKEWPTSLLLHGPPGTGKTSLVRAIVRECNAHLTVISPHSVHKAEAGESERVLRDAFGEASSHAKLGKPSVIFIDEIDVLCPRCDSKRPQAVRLTYQIKTLMDSNRPSSPSELQVIVVASTNRVEAIDPVLRRNGRFGHAIEVTTPIEDERLQILQVYTKEVPLCASVDLRTVASMCTGYVGADLEALCREAVVIALNRVTDAGKEPDELLVTMDDWMHAKSNVGPSVTRGVTVEIPKVSWDDIGGLKSVKKKLQQAVEWPIKHSATFSRLGVSPVRGVLLHGPPGCSKTTLAKAAANAAQSSFFSLSGAELYSMYVGEGESLLRNTFRRARLAAPSIIFFDEADVIASKRGGKSSSSSSVGERLLSTLLTEMDGLEEAKGILVLAATNRPHAIDAALLRPGRFDMVLYVPPPDMESRYEILRVHTRHMKVGDDVDLKKIAEDTELFTGAELEGLCREAGMVALRESMQATAVCDRHFQIVRKSLKAALTKEEVNSYASFSKIPSVKSPDSGQLKSEANGKMERIGKDMRPLLPKIGATSFLLVAASLAIVAQYFFVRVNQPNILPST